MESLYLGMRLPRGEMGAFSNYFTFFHDNRPNRGIGGAKTLSALCQL
jgi:hypothetical protein